MGETFHVKARTGHAFELSPGQELTIIDVAGGQVADLFCFARADDNEWLSNGRTFDYNGTLRLTQGHVLYSNRSRPMLRIIEDTVRRHDFLYAPCSVEMFRLQYGIEEPHPNCLDNLSRAVAVYGLSGERIVTPFNAFMNVEIDSSGELAIEPPLSRAGDRIGFRAEMELIVAVSACSAEVCNGGSCTPIEIAIA